MHWPYDIIQLQMLKCEVLEAQSLWYAGSVIDQSVPNIKFLKKEGANDQYGHNNDTSAIKEHIDITIHKILKKVQVPEIMKNEEISISYVLLESISNNRRRYLWYEVALNDINCDEDLEFKSVI